MSYPDEDFIFMPAVTVERVEPFVFTWRGFEASYDHATQTITAPILAADPVLASWLQTIFPHEVAA